MIRVCYFGAYSPEYSRSRILLNGLPEHAIQISECHSRSPGFTGFFELMKQHWKIRKQYNVMIVGYPGQRLMLLAKILSRKPIVFDAFISLYDTRIFDRNYAKPSSLRALYYWFQDWLSCQLADKILLDTHAHIEYFVQTFHIHKNKFCRVLVGSDDTTVFPLKNTKPSGKFLVHFHGTFIPLQGIEYIIQAAAMLQTEDIHFRILGKGQTFSEMQKLAWDLKLNNLTFEDSVPYDQLKEKMSQANICLGIFGKTDKANRVIPNKVYEAIAVERACITGDSQAIREVFTDRENILLANLADANDLAKKILELKHNPILREQIAKNGYKLFYTQLTPKQVTQDLANMLKQLSNRSA